MVHMTTKTQSSTRREATGVIFILSMSIPVLLFASYADAFGAPRLEVPIAVPCLVEDLVQAMRSMPGGTMLPTAPLVVVNHTWATVTAVICEGDEVALIPPVAGG